MLAELDDARVLITGGTGFVGSALIDFASASRAELHVLTRDASAFRARRPELARRVSFIEGSVEKFASDIRFTHVVHAASYTRDAVADHRSMFSTIVDGTRHVLDLAANCSARVLFVSSGAVYGPQPGPIREDCTEAPRTTEAASVYGEAKRAAEMLCTIYADRVPSVIARGFTFSGRFMELDRSFAITSFLRAALRGGPIEVSQPLTTRSYLDSSDMAEWLFTMLFRGIPGRAYNVGSPDAVTMQELAALIRRLLDDRVDVAVGQGGGASTYVPDVSRAQSELSLAVKVPLEASIRRMIEPLA